MSSFDDPRFDDPRCDEPRVGDPREDDRGAEDPPPGGSRRRRRHRSRRLQITAGLLGLLLVLILVVPRDSNISRTLPVGGFGQAIRCLERDQLDRVQDTTTGAVPTSRTESVVVQKIHGTTLAELREAPTAAAARALARRDAFGSISPADPRSAGRIAWAYALNGDPPHVVANAGERTLIGFCVRTPGRAR